MSIHFDETVVVRSKLSYIIISVVIITILISLISISSDSKTPSTILAVDTSKVAINFDAYTDKHIRLRGFVKPTTLVRFNNKATFDIEQNGAIIPVYFNGASLLPDTFADGAAVRVEGTLHEQNGRHTFEASVIEAKCSSKYEVKHDTNIY